MTPASLRESLNRPISASSCAVGITPASLSAVALTRTMTLITTSRAMTLRPERSPRPQLIAGSGGLKSTEIGGDFSRRQAAQGFLILRARLRDDLRRQLRPGRLLVPVEGFEIIAHELLVEARRAGAGAVGVGGPEPRGVGRERLIDQRQRAALIDAELELGVGNDDAAARGVRRRKLIERDGGVADTGRERRADELLHLRERDVLVVFTGARLRCGSEEGRRQPCGEL